MFQHDGAAVHRSKTTQKYIRAAHIKMFNDASWPANSPDMNIIEHVWPMLTQRLSGSIFHNREQLWNALKKAAQAIPKENILRLYKSLPDRMKAVQVARGGPTRY